MTQECCGLRSQQTVAASGGKIPYVLKGIVTKVIKQIMPEVIILGCIYALPAYRDLMRAKGPEHIPLY